MKLAFSGQGRYPEFEDGYALYVKRARSENIMSLADYKRTVRAYCRMMAEALYRNGMIDLPSVGSVCTAIFRRKPRYGNGKFIGYGKYDWETKQFDGTLKTFGITFLPRHDRNQNLRCYGFVTNRALFKRIKEAYEKRECNWVPIEFNDKMI